MVARLRARQLIRESGKVAQLCGTIHDSIVVDTPKENVYNIGGILKQAVEDVPQYCQKLWGYDFSLPLKCEVSYGKNKTDMKELIL